MTQGARRVGAGHIRPVREVLLAVVFYVAYARVRDAHGTASVDDVGLAQRHGLAVLHLEQRLHLNVELGVQHAALHSSALVRAMDIFYGSFHFLATCAVFVGLTLRAPAGVFLRARNLIAVTTALALIGFALYPTMPPRLLPVQYGYQDTLATVGGLWSYNHGVVEHISDPFAAMPSLHVAWATWCAVALGLVWTGRRARLLLALYPVVTSIIVLVTGSHWLLDIAAGEAVLVLAWGLVRLGEHSFARERVPVTGSGGYRSGHVVVGESRQ